jgi:hypothetical protein
MPDTQTPEQTELNTPRQHDPRHDPMHLERRQPDPMHDLSERRMGDGGMSLVAVAIVVILAIVLFGLNGRSTETTPTQQIPLAAE